MKPRGRYPEAEKEAGYAMRVEEAAYGRNSIKLLDRLDKLARWYEGARRYTSERNIYERSLGILSQVPRLKTTCGAWARCVASRARTASRRSTVSKAPTMASTFNSGNTGAPVFADGSQQRRGESSLTSALEIIDTNSPANEQMRGEVLTDLGDWFLISNALRRAYDTYADAWKAFSEGCRNTKLLEAPRVLAYRPSVSSVDRSQLDPAEAVLKVVEMHFKVDRDGRIDEVTSPTTDVPENIVRNSISSMRRSRYAPRIENGAAVATNDVVFLERVLVKVTSSETGTTSEKEKEAAKPAAPSPGPAPDPQPPPAGR